MITLRPYQKECLAAIAEAGAGRHLIQLPTGTGKTVVFANIPRHGRMMILSHRQELVHQPVRYFDCPVGIEMGADKAMDEEVVSASVQTMSRRMERYPRDAFHTIIVDEAHHATADTYKSILSYFTPSRVLGFTATPNRADGKGLSEAFDDIIFQRDLRWGIENGWLSRIVCKRLWLGYDLTSVATRLGDFKQDELGKVMDVERCNQAIAQAVAEIAEPPVLIFAVNVSHAKSIASLIPGAVAVDGSTDSAERAETLERFKRGEIPVLVNCALFTEGTDLPNVRTVIVARPTKSNALYVQMVGRGTRLARGKDHCLLIDCVGVTKQPICTAPSLLGMSVEAVPPKMRHLIEGDLLDGIPEVLNRASDTPESWIRACETVELFAKSNEVNTHGIRWNIRPNGDLFIPRGDGFLARVSAPDSIGRSHATAGNECKCGTLQECLDWAFQWLTENAGDCMPLWSRNVSAYWEDLKPSEKQIKYIERLAKRRKVKLPSEVMTALTRGQASNIIARLA